ncbi:MAG: hypothetical protein LBS56_07565, partial [Propionibacteriaceae bacterium]|nr:hypothetical protein [Propionibacteriaceae bacterium]
MTARGPRAPRERFTAGFLNHLRGRRLVVVDEPATAVETSAGHFQAQGFEPYPVDLNQKLASAGSPWVAQAVVIGQRSGLVRGWVNTAIEVTPLALLPFVTRNIPPTLVMVAAQPLPDRSCELLFQPLTSTSVKRALIDSEDDSLASP